MADVVVPADVRAQIVAQLAAALASAWRRQREPSDRRVLERAVSVAGADVGGALSSSGRQAD